MRCPTCACDDISVLNTESAILMITSIGVGILINMVDPKSELMPKCTTRRKNVGSISASNTRGGESDDCDMEKTHACQCRNQS
jgi:hypothetical protein